ncbi:hypothetical protein D1641_00605 [Colidextribacter sp. OB.20]|nr:hypothetical protein [Colidextribacter sp. OB.20]
MANLIMPQLPVKIKEENMDWELLNDLEEAFGQLSDGLIAMKLMTFGLEDMQDPKVDGFYAARPERRFAVVLAQAAVVKAIA